MARRFYGVVISALAIGGVCSFVTLGFRRPRVIPPPPATSSPRKSAPQPKTVRLLAVGDLMLGTSLQKVVRTKGADFPFRPWRKALSGADLLFGNLETPLSERGTPTPGKSPESLATRANFLFRGPSQSARGVANAGFSAVSVANNHVMDYGPDALSDTLQVCRKARGHPVGAGPNLHAAYSPVYLTRGGQRFAFFALSDILPPFSAATVKTAGIAPARGDGFEKRMRAAIRLAHRHADWVLVSVHWGKEKFGGATPRQRQLGHALIDWETDVVIGSHTHCLGPVEHYHRGLIHYSLGNFLSAPGSRANVPVWEVRFPPGRRPIEQLHMYRWDGKPLPKQPGISVQQVALTNRATD